MMKKSAKEVTSRRSSTLMSVAFLDSAARTAVNQTGGTSVRVVGVRAVLLSSPMLGPSPTRMVH